MVDFRVPRSNLKDPNDPEQLVLDVIQPMWNELATPYKPDMRLIEATAGQRAVYALYWTQSEIRNGGFRQYFDNSTGMLGNEAVVGGELIGASEIADLIREAMSIFPAGTLIEENERRRNYIDLLPDEALAMLSKLDERFYRVLGRELFSSLDLQCAAYVERHPEEFFTDP